MKKYQLRTISLALLLLTSGNALAVTGWETIGLFGVGYLVGTGIQKNKQRNIEEFGSPKAAWRNKALISNVNAGSERFVKLWIALGADPNCDSRKYGTPLHVARRRLASASMCQLLEDLGATAEEDPEIVKKR